MLGFKELDLANANAVLSGAGAAHGQRSGDEAIGEMLRRGHLFWRLWIDRHDQMEVAVADVAHERADERRVGEVRFRFTDAVRQP